MKNPIDNLKNTLITLAILCLCFLLCLALKYIFKVAELENSEIDEEREILIILAPFKTSKQIIEDVNKEFGINSKANGIIAAIATEKAYKI